MSCAACCEGAPGRCDCYEPDKVECAECSGLGRMSLRTIIRDGIVTMEPEFCEHCDGTGECTEDCCGE